MKSFRKNIILLILICIIVLYFVLKDDFNGIVELLINSNKLYILIAIGFMLISDIFKGVSVSRLVKASGYTYSVKNGFLLMLMTNFFNGITPFSLGGQPFELYILKKDSNVDYITGSNVLFKDFYTYQMALMFLSTLCIILTYSLHLFVLSSIAEKILWFGFIINIGITLVLIYIPHSKKSKYKVINSVIRFFGKIGIIKNKDKVIEKVDGAINKFKKQTNEVIKEPKVIIGCILLNCFKLIMVCISAYFCFRAISSAVPLFETIIISILIMIMASFVPIPGASGGMEFSFFQLFSYFVIDAKLGAAMLMWRFVTYYLPMIYGSIIFVFKRK